MKTPILLICLISCFLSGFAQEFLPTFYERSGGTKTPRYEETIDYCKKLADTSSMVYLSWFGTSPQGRPLPYMVVDKDGFIDPQTIKSAGRIILMIEACIHPGESEGKDAGLMLIRDLIAHRTSHIAHRTSDITHLLDHISILFIPIFNVDGHERFGPYNRINQNGPEEMGWRVTATNLNLNRDFLKADAPEMQAWLKFFNRWKPDFFIDIHTTDGADYQYVITYMMETLGNMDPGLTAWCDTLFLPTWKQMLEEAGYPVFPYVEFRRWHDPKSGLVRDVAPPMLSQGYVALRNRPGLLIETHMLKPYKQRVEATYACLLDAIEILNHEYQTLRRLNQKADSLVTTGQFLDLPFTLQYRISRSDSTLVPFRGVEYFPVQSDITNGTWFQYQSDQPVVFEIPLFDKAIPKKTVSWPEAYIIPPQWHEVIMRLRLHGIEMKPLKQDSSIMVTSYRFKDPSWRFYPYEGRHPLTGYEYESFTETITFPEGSVIVTTSQPSARVIAHLLEPDGDGSLLYWGFFDPIFEQKEYFEFYVMEPMAKKMLEDDPELRKAFEQKMASDSAFAKSQWQILNWFLERTPYADTRKMVYPVARIERN